MTSQVFVCVSENRVWRWLGIKAKRNNGCSAFVSLAVSIFFDSHIILSLNSHARRKKNLGISVAKFSAKSHKAEHSVGCKQVLKPHFGTCDMPATRNRFWDNFPRMRMQLPWAVIEWQTKYTHKKKSVRYGVSTGYSFWAIFEAFIIIPF